MKTLKPVLLLLALALTIVGCNNNPTDPNEDNKEYDFTAKFIIEQNAPTYPMLYIDIYNSEADFKTKKSPRATYSTQLTFTVDEYHDSATITFISKKGFVSARAVSTTDYSIDKVFIQIINEDTKSSCHTPEIHGGYAGEYWTFLATIGERCESISWLGLTSDI